MLVGTFNKEKVLVGAFSVIVKSSPTFVSSSKHLPTAGAARGAARQAGGRHREVHRGRAGGGGQAGAAGAAGQQGVAGGARHQLQDLPRQQTLVQREGSAALDIVKYNYLWKMWHNTTLIYQEIKNLQGQWSENNLF